MSGTPKEGRERATAMTIFAGLLFALCFGYAVFAGLGSAGQSRWIDAQWLYVSGKCWLAGESPYDVAYFFQKWRECFGRDPIDSFVYPPHIAVFTVPLGLFEWETARRLVDWLNVAALGVCLLLLWRLMPAGPISGSRPERRWLSLGSACLLSSVPAVLYTGQTSLIALAGLIGVWYSAQRQRGWLLVALCVFVASIKPHAMAPALLYLLVAGALRRILLGLALTLAVTVAVLAQSPAATLFGNLAASLESHMSNPFNAPWAFTGVSSLLSRTTMSAHLAMVAATLLAVVCVGVADRRRFRTSASGNGHDGTDNASTLRDGSASGFLFAIALTGTFLPLHTYDFVIYVPIVALTLAGAGPTLLGAVPGLLLVARPDEICAVLKSTVGECRQETIVTLGALWILTTLALHVCPVVPGRWLWGVRRRYDRTSQLLTARRLPRENAAMSTRCPKS